MNTGILKLEQICPTWRPS